MFQPNLNPKPNKSYRKRLPEPDFEHILNENLVKNPSKHDLKPMRCKHNRNIDMMYGEIYCSKCFAIHDSWMVKEEDEKVKNANIIIWSREYDKSRWTGYSLDMMMGKNNSELPDQLWLDIIRDIPDPFRWYDVYKVFQKHKLLKYWVGFGHFIGMGPKLNKTIMAYFNTYMEIGHGKYSISYYYLLYKFTEMFGNPGDEQYIPLKNCVAWCKKTDEWWETVCDEHQWIFTKTKVHWLSWNKEEVLSKFATAIKKYLKDCQAHLENN